MLLVFSASFAQNENWIIGNSGRLNFNTNPPNMASIETENGVDLPVISSGYSSVSDACGRLLFVTNGHQVWTYSNGSYIECNDTFAEMPRTDIRQNVAIIPKPNNLNNFYILTVTNSGIYFTDFYVETDGSAGHVATSFKMDSTNGYPDFNCTALSANVQKYFGSNTVFKSRIMLFNQTNKSLYTYYIDEYGINSSTERISDLTSIISNNSYVTNFTSLGIGIYDNFAFSTNLGELVFFNLYNYSASGPAFLPIASIGTQVTGLSLYSLYGDSVILYVGTGNGLYKSVYNTTTSSFDTPVQFASGTIGDLQMGNDGKIYGALQGESTLLRINDPNNYTNPNVTYYPLGFVNTNAHLGQSVIRNPKLSYLNLVNPTFTQINPVCYGTSVTLPTTSNNGITGTWSPAFNSYSSGSYTFTPNQGQCADVAKMSISVYSLPNITAQPTAPAATCSGSGIQTLSVTAPGSGLIYSWKRNGTPPIVNGGAISGQGTASLKLTNPTVANAGTYYVDISTATCPTAVRRSNNVTVTVNSPPAIATQPTAPVATCSGSGIQELIVATTGSVSTYSWRRNGVILVNDGVISGKTTNKLKLTGATTTNAGSYDVVISGTCSPGVTSNAVTVTVNSPPAITTQPTTPTATCSGSGIQTISVTASGSGLIYSWRRNGLAVENIGVFSGKDSNTLILTNPTENEAGSYDVVVSGTCTPAVTSNTVAVTVNTLPTITVQPIVPTATCSGTGTQVLTVIAQGSGILTYTWKKNGIAVENIGVFSGQGSKTLTLTNATENEAGSYSVTVSSDVCPTEVTSEAVTVTVNTPPTIMGQPTTPNATYSGSGNQELTVEAIGSGLLTYSWRKNGVVLENGGIFNGLGNETLTLINPSESDAGSYDVVVSGTCFPDVISIPVTVTVNPLITPTFNTVNSIVSGSLLNPLPTLSNNNISGTWSPAFDNTQTQTYTFLPNPGQFAKTTTLMIEVTQQVDPSSTGCHPNYISKKTYKEEAKTSIPNPTPEQVIEQIIYYDGLGRPIQQKDIQMSNSGKDIVIPIEYDGFGRQAKEYLPYVNSVSSRDYECNPIPNVMTFYGTQNALMGYPNFETTDNPYSEKIFESSPLNRVKALAAPGEVWKAESNGVDHTIKYDYQTNSANEVKLFKATSSENNGLYSISLEAQNYYLANVLYKSVIKNENWTFAENNANKNNTTEEFKDKNGRVVLKRTYESSDNFDTYYIYDQYGNLTYVIPPKVDVSNGPPSEEILNGLCYQYKYDYRNRLVEKKLPGKNWEFIVYDKLDRVVATGPVSSPFNDIDLLGWMITKYDVFNRVVITGWMQSNDDRKSLQDQLNVQSNSCETKFELSYTNNAWPNSSLYQKLTINYYDNYNADFSFTPAIAYLEEGYNNSTKKPIGLPTMSWIRVCEASTANRAERSYILYDKKGRAVVNFTNNYLEGYTKVESQIQYITGRVDQTITTHKRSPNDFELKITDRFTYSAQDRLLTHTHQIGEDTPQLLANNKYSELGQLISKRVGSKIEGDVEDGLQKVDYSYNIRGWLKSINNVEDLEGIEETDLFAFKINYNTVDSESFSAKPQYNGNIAEITWKTNDNKARRYNYTYDKLNRLTNAVYSEPNTPTVPNLYAENIEYDKNGNITHLDRYNKEEETNQPNLMDGLTYSYSQNSNQLMKVFDSTNDSSGFDDDSDGIVDPDDDYGYDRFGNLTTDKNKNITEIVYNHLNLPTKITFDQVGTIEYIYNAAGQKLKKIVTGVNNTTTTDYLGGFQYQGIGVETPILQFFPHAEGYVKKNAETYTYVFNYTDHLGNVRMSYTNNNDTLEILEENNYYPFGLKQEIDNDQENYEYKYNGKEFESGNNLNMTEMDFRQYDNALGRFNVIDPLAEMDYSMTPYHFTGNNPVAFSDPSGMRREAGQTAAVYYDWETNGYRNNEGAVDLYDLSNFMDSHIKEMSNVGLAIDIFDGDDGGFIVSGLNHVAHEAFGDDPKPNLNINVSDKVVGETTFTDQGREFKTPLYEMTVTGTDVLGNEVNENFKVSRIGIKNGKVQSLKPGNYKLTDFRRMSCGLMGFAINGGPYFIHAQTSTMDNNWGCITMDKQQWIQFKTVISNTFFDSSLTHQQIVKSNIINLFIQGNVKLK